MWFVNKNKAKGMPTRRLATKTTKKFVLKRNNNRLWDFVHKRLAFNKLLRKSTSTRSRQPIRSSNLSYVKVLQSFSPLLIIVIILSALWWSGYPQKVSDALSQKGIEFSGKLGLRVDEIMVEGRHQSSSQQILSAVAANRGEPILIHNLDEIKNRLQKIDWVRSATVKRQLPNILYISLAERNPIALWQHQKNYYLVDDEGVVISNPSADFFKRLPIVAGDNAPAHVSVMIKILEKFPVIRKKLKTMVWIRQRRWDLNLEGNIQVKLPENKPEAALVRLSFLIEKNKLIAGDVSVVDLRIPKQTILKLSPEAAVRAKIKGKET